MRVTGQGVIAIEDLCQNARDAVRAEGFDVDAIEPPASEKGSLE